MKDVTLTEWAIIAAIALILGVLFLGFVENRKAFKAVCDETGGTTVYDGRQYQCFKK